MKNLLLFILLSLVLIDSFADTGDPAKKEKSANVSIHYRNHDTKSMHRDSVLVIFDKYDRTGSGVIKQIFYPGKDHSIIIPRVKPGKYIIIIHFLGFHGEQFQKTVLVKSRKVNTVTISLRNSEEFSEDKIIIPDEHIDLANLSITRN